MTTKGYMNKQPLDLLSKGDLESIHLGILHVLENTGVVFHHAEALKILQEAGCNVDLDKELVKFPPYLVEESLRKCPSSFILKARNPKYTLRIGDPNVYFSCWAGKDYIDLDTLERRVPTKKDYIETTRVLASLKNVNWAGYSYNSTIAEEGVTGHYMVPYITSLFVRNSEKTGWVGLGDGAAEWSLKIFQAAGSDCLCSVTASAPLTWPREQIGVLLHCARAGMPLKPTAGIVMGATSPVTLAGALVQSCAEVISSIVLAQVVRPGAPVIAQDYSQPLDFRTGLVVQGGIERGLMGAAWCQIFRNYHIPRMTLLSSDAKYPDYQCAMEKSTIATMHALAGSNIASFMGTVYDELLFSAVVAIIDNDIASMIGRVLEGINVNSTTLATELIGEVGPVPGHYLAKRHTKDMWRQEQVVPVMSDRLSYPDWVNGGRKDIVTRAKEKYKEILATYNPSPLSDDQNKEIDQLLKEAKADFKARGFL